MNFNDIDWNRMWRESHRKRYAKCRTGRDWDRRAVSFAKRNLDSAYGERLLKIMRPDPSWTVLDVGSGPGTMTIPLARQVKKITAIDFSGKMLELLQDRAASEGLHNVEALQAAWEDDWRGLGIKPHDVALASRSLSIQDLPAALAKLNVWAAKKVFVCDRVGPGPFDPDVFAAIGRDFDPGPDYIFTVNMLYKMGIHARVDFIELDREQVFGTKEEAYEAWKWMVTEMNPEEEQLMRAFADKKMQRTTTGNWKTIRRTVVKWAVISWQKDESVV